MNLAAFLRYARRQRHLSAADVVRHSGRHVSLAELRNIEAAVWDDPPSAVLFGIATGLEPDDPVAAADLWAQMMRLSGQLSDAQIAAVQRLTAFVDNWSSEQRM